MLHVKKNQILFAVTDHNEIMSLVVTHIENDIKDLDGWLLVKTELADKETSHQKSALQQAYFRKFFIGPDGISSRAGIFESKQAAIAYAEKSIDSQLRLLTSQMDTLNAKRAKLRTA